MIGLIISHLRSSRSTIWRTLPLVKPHFLLTSLFIPPLNHRSRNILQSQLLTVSQNSSFKSTKNFVLSWNMRRSLKLGTMTNFAFLLRSSSKTNLFGYSVAISRPPDLPLNLIIADRRLGPYCIIKKIGSSAYLLDFPFYLSRLHPVFNVALLEPYHDPSTFRPHSSPEPFHLADDPALSIQTIHDARKIGHRFEYFVCWKDLPESENSSIPLSDIPTSQNELIDRFHRRHPQAPRPHTIVLNQTFSIPPTTHSPSVSIELTPQTSSPHTDSVLAVPQASSTLLAPPAIPPAAARPAPPLVIHQRLRSEYVPPIQTTTHTGRVSEPAQCLDPKH